MAAGMGIGGSFSMGDIGMSQGGGGPSPAKVSYDEVTLSPLTVHQFQTARIAEVDGRVTVDGMELKELVLCGRVVEAEPTDSGLTIVLEDGTGRTRAKQWYSTNADGSTNAVMKEELDGQVLVGSFVRLYGSCKLVSNRVMISNAQAKVLTDPNELTLHLVECIHVHLDRTRRISYSEGGSSPEGMATTNAAGEAPAVAAAGTGFGMGGMGSMPGVTSTSMSAMGGGFGGAPATAAGSVNAGDLGDRVNSKICTYTGDNGAPVAELVQFFAGQGVSEAEVRQAVEELSMAGRIYSTVDDEHVKSTEEGL